MALYFPKINQIRFESPLFTDHVNEDQINPDLSESSGVYPHRFYQPIPKTWTGIVGDGNELDFNIIGSLTNWAAEEFDCSIYRVTAFDKYSNVNTETLVETLTPAVFYTYSSGRKQYRFTKSLGSYTTGFYRVKLVKNAGQGVGTVYYQSNVLNIDTLANFPECYTFSGTNFENDFGVAWLNSTPATWYLKVLLPCRQYKPQPKVEKDVYLSDPGNMVTLRTRINRNHEFESLPIPMWYGELFQMAMGLSSNYINRIKVNFESIPTQEPIADSNLCVLKGVVTQVDFNDNYLLNI